MEVTCRVSTSLARWVTGRNASASSEVGIETSTSCRRIGRRSVGNRIPGGTGLKTSAEGVSFPSPALRIRP